MKPIKIGIQGELGSNHHSMARILFPMISDDQIVCFDSFEELLISLEKEELSQAVMAIENSIAGSIHANWKLLNTHSFSIVGEGYLPIHHQLIAHPGTKPTDIEVVYSHPMALAQCEAFLRSHHLEAREFSDTAAAVTHIKQNALTKSAAIAPALAANLQKMEIIASDIEDYPNTVTRFLVVQKHAPSIRPTGEVKVMLECVLSHTKGSLAALLSLIANHNGNLTKIESLPIPNAPWEYRFFLDFCIQSEHVDALLSMLLKSTRSLRIHGIFPQEKGGV